MSDVNETTETEVAETEELEETEIAENETETEVDAEAETEDDGVSPEVKDLKDQLEKLKKSLVAARGDTKAEKKRAAELAAKVKQVEAAELSEIERLQAQLEEANAKNQKYFDVTVKSAVNSALKDAGAKVATSRLMKMMDLSTVEIDEDGDIVGVDGLIEELKADFPEGFTTPEETKPKVSKPRGNIDPGQKTPAPPKPLPFAQQLIKNAKRA